MLGANARWFSFGIQRQIAISLELWRVATEKEMTALKPVRRASPESTLEWIMLIRDKNVSTAYSRLAKIWIRLNNKHWLSVKFLHMFFVCKTRSRINSRWTAFSEWKDYSDEIAPALHSSGSIVDLFASLRPKRSSALVRMMNEAV